MQNTDQHKERGNLFLRRLDRLVGIPLVQILSLTRRNIPAAPSQPEHIAVLCLGAIGDTLLSTAMLNALSSYYPQAHINICASMSNFAALPLLNPNYTVKAFPIRDVSAIIRHLRGLKVDILIDTTQWARVGAFISQMSGAKYTIGFDTPGQYRGAAYNQAVPHLSDRHEVDNFLALAGAIVPSAAAVPSLHMPTTPPQQIDLEQFPRLDKIIYLHMFAAGVSAYLKEWPETHWRELALACCKAGFTVCFTGSQADMPRMENFLQEHIPTEHLRSGAVRSLVGEIPLTELAWLLQRGAGAVSVNTGVLHLAALCGLPVIDLHGPTSPLRWGGVGSNVISLLAPGEDTAYLNLGFENSSNSNPILHRLSVDCVLQGLRKLGVSIA